MAISRTLRHANLVHTFQPAGDSDAILTRFTSGTETSFNSLTVTDTFNVANAKSIFRDDLVISNNSNTATFNAPTINIGRDSGTTMRMEVGQDSDDKLTIENGTYDIQGRTHLRNIVELGNDSDVPVFLTNFTGVSGSSITLQDLNLGVYDLITATSLVTRDSDFVLTGNLTINGSTTVTGALNGNDSEFIFSGNVSGTTGTFTSNSSFGTTNVNNLIASPSSFEILPLSITSTATISRFEFQPGTDYTTSVSVLQLDTAFWDISSQSFPQYLKGTSTVNGDYFLIQIDNQTPGAPGQYSYDVTQHISSSSSSITINQSDNFDLVLGTEITPSDISTTSTLAAKSFTSSGAISGTTFVTTDSDITVTFAGNAFDVSAITTKYITSSTGTQTFNTLSITDSDLIITNNFNAAMSTGTFIVDNDYTTVDLSIDSESAFSLSNPSIANLTIDSDLDVAVGTSAANATHTTSVSGVNLTVNEGTGDSDLFANAFSLTSTSSTSINATTVTSNSGNTAGATLTTGGNLTANSGTFSAGTITTTTLNATSGTAQGASTITTTGIDIGTTFTSGNLTLGDSDLSVGGTLSVGNDMILSSVLDATSVDITGAITMTNLTLSDSDAKSDSDIISLGAFNAPNAVISGLVTVGTTLTQEQVGGTNVAAFGVSSGILDINANFVLTDDISTTALTTSGIAGVNLILSADSDATLKCSAMSGFGTLEATNSNLAAATNTFTGLTVNGDATKDLAVTGNITAGSNNADISGNLTVSGNQFDFDGTNYVQVNSLPIQNAAGTTLATFRFLST